MQPICLLLPVGSDIAVRLWSVVELGIQPSPVAERAPSRDSAVGGMVVAPRSTSTGAPDHLYTLASLFRAHLLGFVPCRGGLWMDRRELADLLRLLECGLSRLELRNPQSDNVPLTLESVSMFLSGIRAQMGTARKPVQRQTGVRVRAATAVGN